MPALRETQPHIKDKVRKMPQGDLEMHEYSATIMVKMTVTQFADTEAEFTESLTHDLSEMEIETHELLGIEGTVHDLTEEKRLAEEEEYEAAAEWEAHMKLETAPDNFVSF